MVLESIVLPNDQFSNSVLHDIQEEVVYWKASSTEIWISRTEVTSFPIPVHLYHRNHDTNGWVNYGDSLLDRGIAQYGSVDLTQFDYYLFARGIDAAVKRSIGRA